MSVEEWASTYANAMAWLTIVALAVPIIFKVSWWIVATPTIGLILMGAAYQLFRAWKGPH